MANIYRSGCFHRWVKIRTVLLEKFTIFSKKREEVAQYFFRFQVRSGMGHMPEECVAESALRRFSFGLRLAIVQADAKPVMPISYR